MDGYGPIIVGAIIGVIAGAITNKGGSMGWIANILAGLIGFLVRSIITGNLGTILAGMALVPINFRCYYLGFDCFNNLWYAWQDK